MLSLVLELLLIGLCVGGVFVDPLAFFDYPLVIELNSVLLGFSQFFHLLFVELSLVGTEFLERGLQSLLELLLVVLIKLML